LRVAKLILMKL